MNDPQPKATQDEPEENPFRLAGSMQILVSCEDLEAGIEAERKHQAELFLAKMRRWMED